MPPSKYKDFILTEQYLKDSLVAGPGAPKKRLYQGIKCPHCKVVFSEITVDNVVANKAMYCLAHLRGNPSATPPIPPCAAAAAANVTFKTKEKRDDRDLEIQRLKEEMQRNDQMLKNKINSHERKLKRVMDRLEMSSHSSEDDEHFGQRVVQRVDNGHERVLASAYGRVADAANLSPQRESETPVAMGERVMHAVVVNTVDSTKLRSGMSDVHLRLGIEPEAPPVERVDSIEKLKKDSSMLEAHKRMVHKAKEHFADVSRAAGCEVHTSRESQVGDIRKLYETALDQPSAREAKRLREERDSAVKKAKTVHKEYSRELKQAAENNSKVARSVKVLASELPDGKQKEVMKASVPSSGTTYDESWSASGSNMRG